MRYFNLYFKESDKIQEFNAVHTIDDEKGLRVYEYNYTKEDILKIINSMPDKMQKDIRKIFIMTDLKGGDINIFLNGLCEKFAQEQTKEKEAQYVKTQN